MEQHAARCDTCRRLLAELGRSPTLKGETPTAPLGPVAHISLERGQKVGRFMVLNRIGAGGMSVVFAAYDPTLDRKVALKLLRSPREGAGHLQAAQLRLRREAQAIAQLSHPNVIAVYDVGTYQNEVYIAMELVEGETLTSWLRRWERPWRDILDKFLDAGSALAAAHASGLAHRDFKPDNVLVGHDERVRVMDFGLARSLLLDHPPAPATVPDAKTLAMVEDANTLPGPDTNMLGHLLTGAGALVGTPRYMAPEQFAGKETDARSDQFSFCVALYEALYKQHPFEAGTALGLVTESATVKPRPAPAGTEVPEWLHRTLLRGLSADAKDRFPSMHTLLRALTPPPLQPSRLRFIAALAVAVLGLLTSAYAVPALIGARSDYDKLHIDLIEAQTRLGEFEKEIAVLIRKLEEQRNNSNVQQQVIDDLHRKLVEAQASLARAEETLGGLTRTPSGPGTALRPAGAQATSTGQRPGNNPGISPALRSQGLQTRDILAKVTPAPHDLEVCFREFLERAPEAKLLYGVRLEIDSNGVPARGSRSGGIDDEVLHYCVTSNLEMLRFPPSKATSVVHVKFYGSTEGTLDIQAEVVEIRLDTRPSEPPIN